MTAAHTPYARHGRAITGPKPGQYLFIAIALEQRRLSPQAVLAPARLPFLLRNH